MIKFYYNTSPNPMKIALCLEEMDFSYEAIPIDTRKGDQHSPLYLSINPNAKAPAIEDDGNVVFDSNAILLYLAEKSGKFITENTPKNRANLLSWLMFVATGIGPYSGQSVHFQHMAPQKLDYAINRYLFVASLLLISVINLFKFVLFSNSPSPITLGSIRAQPQTHISTMV